jgi:hypothetical protein
VYRAHVERYAQQLADEAEQELLASRDARRRERFGRKKAS